MKKLRYSKKLRTVALVGASIAGSAGSLLAQAVPNVDLSTAGTAGATAVTAGGTAALPIFAGMVAIGAIVMGFRRLAH